jgi:hypothetical protein
MISLQVDTLVSPSRTIAVAIRLDCWRFAVALITDGDLSGLYGVVTKEGHTVQCMLLHA